MTGNNLSIIIKYDGDGNRVEKTVNGVTTKYLVDTNNLTGYAQVVEEIQNNAVSRQYSYGLDLISQRQLIGNDRLVSFYQYDGHGSVRGLTDSNGNLTDQYDYDSFGIRISSTGTTPNNYLYAGEQFDFDLNLYYNRARYLDVNRGRFWSQDSFEGANSEPSSLHKYLYGSGDPIDKIDPSGRADFSLSSILTTIGTRLISLAAPVLPVAQRLIGFVDRVAQRLSNFSRVTNAIAGASKEFYGQASAKFTAGGDCGNCIRAAAEYLNRVANANISLDKIYRWEEVIEKEGNFIVDAGTPGFPHIVLKYGDKIIDGTFKGNIDIIFKTIDNAGKVYKNTPRIIQLTEEFNTFTIRGYTGLRTILMRLADFAGFKPPTATSKISDPFAQNGQPLSKALELLEEFEKNNP